jgi:circadian clock protein KaiB
MPRKKKKLSAPVPAGTTVVEMRLYIVNSAPNSVLAIANLEAICKEYLKENFRLEIIDILEFPQRALADGVLVTPSLNKLSPGLATKIVGNLSDKGSVLNALGITEKPHEPPQ